MSCPQLTYQEILETDLDSVRDLLDSAMTLAQKMEETCLFQ